MQPRQIMRVLSVLAFFLLLAASASAQTACPVSGCVQGTAGPDVMSGTAGADCLCGLGGNDVINGLAGPDDLYGNGGSDCVFGDEQNDDVFGGGGADRVEGNDGDDDVYGDNGTDCVFGNAGIDNVNGGAGTDVCRSGFIYTACENTSGAYYCVKSITGGGGTYPGPGDTVPINP